jgi:hypothetical protein
LRWGISPGGTGCGAPLSSGPDVPASVLQKMATFTLRSNSFACWSRTCRIPPVPSGLHSCWGQRRLVWCPRAGPGGAAAGSRTDGRKGPRAAEQAALSRSRRHAHAGRRGRFRVRAQGWRAIEQGWAR